MLLGGIESGGTKMVCAVGNENGEVLNKYMVPTTAPEETLNTLCDYFKDKNIDLVTLPIYEEDVNDKINTIYVDTTFERSKTCFEMADKILILPGGTGTICEIFSMLEESRTFDKKEIIILNLDNYYTDIIKIIGNSIKNKYNDTSILDRIKVFNTSDDLINYLG